MKSWLYIVYGSYGEMANLAEEIKRAAIAKLLQEKMQPQNITGTTTKYTGEDQPFSEKYLPSNYQNVTKKVYPGLNTYGGKPSIKEDETLIDLITQSAKIAAGLGYVIRPELINKAASKLGPFQTIIPREAEAPMPAMFGLPQGTSLTMGRLPMERAEGEVRGFQVKIPWKGY
jgi:hypothetical protein